MKHPKKSLSLRNKTVVITGASSGIGKATAEAFAKQGANLILAARGQQALEATAATCRLFGVKAKAVPTDVSVAAQVHHLVTEALTFNNRIDYWINNAGVLSFGKFEETPIEVVDQIVKTNLLGYMHAAHAVLPVFKKQEEGVLINNISIGGWMPAPYGTAYTASKFGIRGLVEGLQGEVSDYSNIHICAMYPGFQKSAGIEHAANFSGIKLSTPPPAFDPNELAAAMVKVAQRPGEANYPDWFSIIFKNLYQIFPRVIRNSSSALMRQVMKISNKDTNTSGNVLQSSTGNMGIHGKTLLPSAPKVLKLTLAGIVCLAAVKMFASRVN
ncbi:SDR family oxidoreductase [Niabella ginsengisoli]|uniref:SDR family oxidoreductase n=1 Tax=Niabella ginsengisoli TaxID=522298 RepID=A0ABS9SGN3_9BACT|nr:SDR family oxidoreductase [Niabella ginsengisoli]MCH5597518.1 SDR family oxidoreductase [Niabella ginsengisoli]